MKKVKSSARFFDFLILGLFVLFIVFTSCTRWEIKSPYEQVDWKNHVQYKANLHTHTTVSGGSLAPHIVVDKYHQLGYKILAITDHNGVTFPWTEFASMQASAQSKERMENGLIDPESMVYENRDPNAMGMIAIQGNEVSAPQHTGSFFSDYKQQMKQEDSTFMAIKAKNGLQIFNHPGRYKHNAQWYADFFKKYNHLIGMEIYNSGDRYSSDRQLWDSVLVALSPVHAIWGFSNDDMHGEAKLGHNWNIFILPELSEEWVRKGMEEGRLFYVYSPEGHSNTNIPAIQSILVNKGQIQIDATGQDSIIWISAGKKIHKGNSIKLDDHSDLSAYVRAEIFGPGGFIMGTQPFYIQKK